jgi:hypothetical protein
VYKTLEFPIIKNKFKYHEQLKEQILKSIDGSPGNSLIEENDIIDKTDWNISNNVPRPYLDVLTPYLLEHLKEHYLIFGASSFQIHNFWFQQYKKTCTHDWHTHQSAQLTNIYYLELPKNAPKTEILNPLNLNDVISLDVAEGDIITLPAFVYHRSPPVEENLRKTVISFNTSLLKFFNDKKTG